MTLLTEIIEGFHMKANMHYNPSMDGRRDVRMEGRKEAYLDCANILEKWRKSIDEDKLDELAEEYTIFSGLQPSNIDTMCGEASSFYAGFKTGYRKAKEE